MSVVVNAVSATTGGATTYLWSVLPELQARLERLVVWRGTKRGPWPAGVAYRDGSGLLNGAGAGVRLMRLWFDQAELPLLLRREGARVLYSFGSFGSLRCPCRQVLLVQNSIYFDQTFYERMPARVRAKLLMRRALTLASMKAADVVLFPSQAMYELVAEHAGDVRSSFRVCRYGTNHDLFQPSGDRHSIGSPVTLLNVSHYYDQKNLGTLLEALRELDDHERGAYHLQLTADFGSAWEPPGPLCPTLHLDRALYRELHHRGIAKALGGVSHARLPDLYRSSDIFVFPSYTESFGLPLLEAMATGLPIVASDIFINREICGDAAVYFERFNAHACAAAIRRVAEDDELRRRLQAAALRRAAAFRWSEHSQQLFEALMA